MTKQPLLDAREIGISFGGVRALDSVSLQIQHDQSYGLIGPNGAGKTTFVNCVSRTFRHNTGSVTFDAKSIDRRLPEQLASIGVARTFQHVHLFTELTVLENVLVGAHHTGRVGMLSYALRLRRSRVEAKKQTRAAMQTLDLLGLADIADRTVDTLPFPQQRRVDIARALASSPDLILLDEPAAGLNESEADDLADTVIQLRRDGLIRAFLLIEHHVDMVMRMCSRVAVLDFGRKIADGTPAEVQRNDAVVEAYLGADVDGEDET